MTTSHSSTTFTTTTPWLSLWASYSASAWADCLAASLTKTPKTPTRYVVYLSQSGLSLPDEAYYREPQHADTLAAFQQHVARMLETTQLLRRVPLTANLTPVDAAAAIVAFETAVAHHHLDAATNREAEKRYNPTSFAEIDANPNYAGYPIAEWFASSLPPPPATTPTRSSSANSSSSPGPAPSGQTPTSPP
ncbi:MAG: hypothetical protein U1U88_001561 [Lawsonella clevelandensis]